MVGGGKEKERKMFVFVGCILEVIGWHVATCGTPVILVIFCISPDRLLYTPNVQIKIVAEQLIVK